MLCYVEVLILKTGHSFFDGISPGFESTSTEKKRVLYRVFTTGLGMLLLCMQSRIHAQRVQVRALLHTLPKIC